LVKPYQIVILKWGVNMRIKNIKQMIVWCFIISFILSSFSPVIGSQIKYNSNIAIQFNNKYIKLYEPKVLILNFEFSDPVIEEDDEFTYVSVEESDFNHIADGAPVLPVKLALQEFMFGTKIISVEYEIPTPEIVTLSKKISYGKCSPRGTDADEDIYGSSDLYPNNWVTFHTGGGLSYGDHKTFLSCRIYPVRYSPLNNQIQYINQISITITYQEPDQPLLDENADYDLLILTPSQFRTALQPLVNHKNNFGFKTILVELSEVYNQMSSIGRDSSEQIKYYIKYAIETWGVRYVLLVGARNGQSFSWNLPPRYSYVVPPDEQERAELFFISDLYYADIYDSLGGFSSWDSNGNSVFSEWDETNKDEMDLYPDVYLGRLACLNNFEVKVMVNKIINYEKDKCSDSWFKNLVLISGDSYNDTNHLNEGKLICEETLNYMPGFNPVRLYASSDLDINRETVKQVIDPGCGFAFFCGHGAPGTWSTLFPPDSQRWVTGFDSFDMIYLKNNEKLPIVVVGGCRNSQFDVSLSNLLINFADAYKQGIWFPKCWSWWLTSKIGGGAIATIGSSGLGTHGREDTDNNGIIDYLEVLDGWLELRFFQLYGVENKKTLGENHGETLTEYLHIFLGSDEKMDVKMVQQWVLLGDPTLQIGGYE